PVEMIDFLLLCNGNHTVQEIVEMIYHRKGHVQFKSVFRTLRYLRDREFLVNGDRLQLPEDPLRSEKSDFLQVKPIFELPIGRRIFNDRERPALFYIIAMLSILSAILSFQLMTEGWLSFNFL